MAPNKILCVAEKPSIAKSVAQHLAGGNINTVGQVSISLYSNADLPVEEH
jgi:DNA topoisomerase IA